MTKRRIPHYTYVEEVDVSEVEEQPKPPGFPDLPGRSYFAYASFSDPDGNGWLLQEVTTRLPGREWQD